MLLSSNLNNTRLIQAKRGPFYATVLLNSGIYFHFYSFNYLQGLNSSTYLKWSTCS